MDISVVIPIYNVEHYLRKCVDSILAQTIHNYEIILVDDGSQDGCAEICDLYAQNHRNVVTFHKVNGGLSDARNYGVQRAHGDYIVFIDSDDYVDPEYLENLWKLHLKYDADIVVQGLRAETEDGKKLGKENETVEKLVDAQEAIRLMCIDHEVPVVAYSKLYPRSYLLKAPYPIGKLHEDVFTTYKILDQGAKIAVSTATPYHYLIRNGSILNSKFSIHHMDALDGANEIIAFCKQKYPEIIDATYVRLAIESVALLHRAVTSEQYMMVRQRVLKEFKAKWNILLKAKVAPKTIRSQLILCKISANAYKFIFLLKKSSVKE